MVRSALANSRPESAEPLHGIPANIELVNALGKRPEDEDAEIAREWSPRGGRKQQMRQRHEGCSPTRDSSDAGGDPSPQPKYSSPSRSPDRGRRQRSSAGRVHRVRGRRYLKLLRSPCKVNRTRCSSKPQKRSLSYSPPRNSRGRGGSRQTRHGHRQLGSSWSSCEREDESEDAVFGTNGTDGDSYNGNGNNASPIPLPDPSTRRSSNLFPGYSPSRGSDSSAAAGNFGTLFSFPGSPYRTYRAKHSRFVHAQSSERTVSETRRRRVRKDWEDELGAGRSRSADGGNREGRRRKWTATGVSGMISPLLRGEGFGLLESNIADKVSISMSGGNVPAC